MHAGAKQLVMDSRQQHLRPCSAVVLLQESDRESQELQQQLKAAADERLQLQAAAQAATAQQREHAQLVSDLTHAVQQQKSQIQVRKQCRMHSLLVPRL
jgi:hypothetical protein